MKGRHKETGREINDSGEKVYEKARQLHLDHNKKKNRKFRKGSGIHSVVRYGETTSLIKKADKVMTEFNKLIEAKVLQY